jgi:hypothetical protein
MLCVFRAPLPSCAMWRTACGTHDRGNVPGHVAQTIVEQTIPRHRWTDCQTDDHSLVGARGAHGAPRLDSVRSLPQPRNAPCAWSHPGAWSRHRQAVDVGPADHIILADERALQNLHVNAVAGDARSTGGKGLEGGGGLREAMTSSTSALDAVPRVIA